MSKIYYIYDAFSISFRFITIFLVKCYHTSLTGSLRRKHVIERIFQPMMFTTSANIESSPRIGAFII